MGIDSLHLEIFPERRMVMARDVSLYSSSVNDMVDGLWHVCSFNFHHGTEPTAHKPSRNGFSSIWLREQIFTCVPRPIGITRKTLTYWSGHSSDVNRRCGSDGSLNSLAFCPVLCLGTPVVLLASELLPCRGAHALCQSYDHSRKAPVNRLRLQPYASAFEHHVNWNWSYSQIRYTVRTRGLAWRLDFFDWLKPSLALVLMVFMEIHVHVATATDIIKSNNVHVIQIRSIKIMIQQGFQDV